MLGVDPPPAASTLVMPAPSMPDDATDVVAALGRRPDVLAARARAAEASASLDLEIGAAVARPAAGGRLQANRGRGHGGGGRRQPARSSTERDARALAAGEQRAAADDALHVERAARAQATRARRGPGLAAEAQRVQRDLVVPAEIARRAARTSFREGAGDVLRLLDAERVYVDATGAAIDVSSMRPSPPSGPASPPGRFGREHPEST